MTVFLTGHHLTLDELVRAAREGETVDLTTAVARQMSESRGLVEHVLERGDPVYGMKTGVCKRKKVRIAED